MGHLNYSELIKNNELWIQEKLKTDSDYFSNLAEGQSPKYLMLGCSDSRVPLSQLMKADPGEIFIHRNIANQANLTDINFLSVLEYSVEHLHIEHIIVVGHYRCGGVAAAIDGVDQGLIENWVAPIKDLYGNNKAEFEKLGDKSAVADRLSELNAVAQAKNILKTPTMERAFKRKKYPHIHSWIFDIYTGRIKEMPLPEVQWKAEGLLPEFY